MKKILIITVLIAIIGAYFLQSSITGNTVSTKTDAVMYKSSYCGCCENYMPYLKTKGFNLDVKDMQDISPIKRQLKVPSALESCHTTVIGNYFVEGHMPIEAGNKLLEEKPDIAGIALPGMPSGSPGMPGSKTEKWKIYAVNHDGTYSEFMTL